MIIRDEISVRYMNVLKLKYTAQMEEALANVNMNSPVVSLIPNVSLIPTTDVAVIKKLLVEQ